MAAPNTWLRLGQWACLVDRIPVSFLFGPSKSDLCGSKSVSTESNAASGKRKIAVHFELELESDFNDKANACCRAASIDLALRDF
jgi:hypothetical protein